MNERMGLASIQGVTILIDHGLRIDPIGDDEYKIYDSILEQESALKENFNIRLS